jgi:hypothetical protein
LRDLQATPNPGFDRSLGASADKQRSAFVCPVSGLDASGFIQVMPYSLLLIVLLSLISLLLLLLPILFLLLFVMVYPRSLWAYGLAVT